MKLAVILACALLLTNPLQGIDDDEYNIFLPLIRTKRMATNYYVDNEAPPGGDGGFATPWDNIAGHVDDLSAGDTMHVRGDVFPARIYDEAKINPTVNGSSGNRITLRPYQAESVTIRNNSGDHTFQLEGDYWTIEDFDGIDHNGIFVYGIEVKAHHVIVQDIGAIHNIGNHNIVIYDGYTYTEIRGNEIHDADRSGTGQDAHGIMVLINADYTIVDGNTIHDCSGDAVQFVDSGWASAADSPADCEITNNVCYRGTVARAEDGLDIKCATDLLIADNTLHGYNTLTGYGITIHNQAPSGTVIRDNVIHGCRRALYLEEGASDTSVYRNLLYDFSDEAVFVSNVSDLDLYNNTIVDAVGKGLRVHGNGWNGGLLKNNLWYNCGNLTLDGGVTFTATAEYNGRWDTTSDAAFVDVTDTTGIGDPGFVNAAADDYRLLITSDAIDAGVDVGLPFSGLAPDLGYWEYEFATTTSTSSTSSSTSTTSTSLSSTSLSSTSSSLSTTSLSTTSTSLTSTSTTSTSLSSTSLSTTSTSLSTTTSLSTSSSLSTSLSTTSSSLSTTSTSLSSTSVSTTSTSLSTTSTSTTSTSSTTTLRFWFRRQYRGVLKKRTLRRMPSCFLWHLVFDGANSVVNCGSEAGLDDIPDGAQITVDGWVKSLSVGELNLGVILQKSGNTGEANGWILRVRTTGLEGRVNCVTDARAVSGTDEFDPTDGIWHHVLMTYDETGASTPVARNVYLAVDGVWVTSYTIQDTGVGAYASDAAEALRIGNNFATTRTFDGDIGWVRVSDSVRYAVDVNFTPPPRCTLPAIDANTLGQWIGPEGAGAIIDNQEGTAARDGTQTDCDFGCTCYR